MIKKISLNEYEKRLNTLSDTYEKQIQELKKELKESKEYIDSDKKDKSKVMIKFNELSKENQQYIKEKQILKQEINEKEQEINEKEQEINEKEQELENNKTKIIDLEYQNKLLKEELDDLEKYIDLKNKENKKAKIKKSFDNLSTPTKIPQSVRKKDDKVRTFAPKETETYKNIEEEINYLPKYHEESDRLKKK